MEILKREEEYRNIEAVNYSSLKYIDSKCPSRIKDKKKKSSYAMRMGTLFERLMMIPEYFHDLYTVESIKEPTGKKMLEFCNLLIALIEKELDFYDDSEILVNLDEFIDKCAIEAYNNSNYSISYENVLNTFNKESREYLKSRVREILTDKPIITESDYEKISSMKLSLQYNKNFTDIVDTNSPDLEIIYQYPIYWYMQNYKCKALLDIVVFNYKERTIQPIDIKTTDRSVWSFSETIKLFRYDLQSAWYTEGCYNLDKKGWEVKPFLFAVVSSKYPSSYSIMYEISYKDIQIGKKGNNNGNIKGWKQLFEEYKWHHKNNLWDYPIEIYRNRIIKTNCY